MNAAGNVFEQGQTRPARVNTYFSKTLKSCAGALASPSSFCRTCSRRLSGKMSSVSAQLKRMGALRLLYEARLVKLGWQATVASTKPFPLNSTANLPP